MGLFVKDDGRYQGWLAALLCCGCAIDTDEHPKEWASRNKPTTTHTQYEQDRPGSSQAPPAYPSSIKSDSDRRKETQQCVLAPASPSETLSFDFDLPQKASQHTRTPAPCMSASSFRRLESKESLRHGLVPLRLAPVVLRNAVPEESVSPIESMDARAFGLDREHCLPASDRLNECSQRADTYVSSTRRSHPHAKLIDEATHLSTSISTQSSATSLYRSTLSGSSSSLTSKSSTDFGSSKLPPKHSGTLSTRPDEPELILDSNVVELNTIHEEHKPVTPPRPSTARSESHIPAVAPNMQVQARSQTLSDIGSILSKPLELKDSRFLEDLLNEPDERRSRSSSRASRLRSRSTSRVSGWLNGVRSSSTSSTPRTHITETSSRSGRALVSRHARGLSRVSRSSSMTMPDSESGTAASSPVVACHPLRPTLSAHDEPAWLHAPHHAVSDQEETKDACWSPYTARQHVGVAL